MKQRGGKRNSLGEWVETEPATDAAGKKLLEEEVDPLRPRPGEPDYMYKLVQYLVRDPEIPAVAPCLTLGEEGLQSSPQGASERLTPTDEGQERIAFKELLGKWSREADSYKTLSEVGLEIDRNFKAIFQHFKVKDFGRDTAVETDSSSSQAEMSSPLVELGVHSQGVPDSTHVP